MGFFQNSVINKHLKVLDKAVVNAAYAKFKECFHNPEIQYNIREAKEEQFQEGFLRELFVKVLGYTLNPQPNYNLTTELKNEKGAKKADGAILQNGKAIAVVELKGTDTKDLDKINTQAFNYKNNQTGCIYVITSNFEKLRFFIHNSVHHLEFNLFTLTEHEFELLWLCLSVDCLLGGIPLKVKEESSLAEENVTKQLYKDYATFRIDLWQNMVKNRPEVDQLLLFKKTQKLLDRFLFIFFAEDSGLLPPNSISRIVKRWNVLQEEDAYKSLYDIFNQYFGYINTGRKGKTPQDDIFAYNGGLFFSDEVLDNIVIDDDVLQPHVMKLTAYDFQSEIDVNILGHIFENSLNEIENVIAKLEGKEIDKNKTKRKKEGVFYTPKYITKYIVDNTVGKLCEEKKSELGVVDEEYSKGRRNRKKETIKKLDEDLQTYRKWLLNITICDPACGSGAFLNQALEFLIAEHAYIDELQAQLLGQSIVFQDVGNHILEKNIYGVDINEESVDIAKLSLWLRTAQRGRKLTFLNNNIKCGNSLIDDTEVAGKKAFDWQKEFPEIFEKYGFDVVIGNPPYVKRQNISDEEIINYLERKYQSATYNFDLYLLFIEKGSKLINEKGLVSYINPSKFTSTKTGKGLRDYLNANCHIKRYIDFKEYQVFEDVTTYCCIFILNNGQKTTTQYYELNEKAPQEIDSFEKFSIDIKDSASGLGWQFKPTIQIKGNQQLKDVVQTFTGIESGADNIYILSNKNPFVKDLVEYNGGILFPVIKGTNVFRYYFEKNPYYGIIPYAADKTLLDTNFIDNKYPKVWSYLNKNKEILEQREKGKMKTPEWYGYVYPKNLFKYNNTRLIWTDISIKPQFVLDKTKSWHVRTVCSLELNEVGVKQNINYNLLLAILNSNLFFYYIKNNSNSVRGGYFRYKPQYVKEFPLPKFEDTEKISAIITECEIICAKTKAKFEGIEKFIKYFQSQFKLEMLCKKLQNWYELEFGDFIKELNKAIVKTGGEKLTKMDEMEWMEVFESKKAEVQILKAEIDKIDKEIDQMVYELYGLTKEEIKIIEQST